MIFLISLIYVTFHRVIWFFKPMNLIDFVTIAPYFIELAFEGTGSNLTALLSLRVLRLLRVLRILKLAKNNKQIPIATVSPPFPSVLLLSNSPLP